MCFQRFIWFLLFCCIMFMHVCLCAGVEQLVSVLLLIGYLHTSCLIFVTPFWFLVCHVHIFVRCKMIRYSRVCHHFRANFTVCHKSMFYPFANASFSWFLTEISKWALEFYIYMNRNIGPLTGPFLTFLTNFQTPLICVDIFRDVWDLKFRTFLESNIFM